MQSINRVFKFLPRDGCCLSPTVDIFIFFIKNSGILPSVFVDSVTEQRLQLSALPRDGFPRSSGGLMVHQFSSRDIQERWKHNWCKITCVVYDVRLLH